MEFSIAWKPHLNQETYHVDWKKAGAVTTCWDTMDDSMAPALMGLPRKLYYTRLNTRKMCASVYVLVLGWRAGAQGYMYI